MFRRQDSLPFSKRVQLNLVKCMMSILVDTNVMTTPLCDGDLDIFPVLSRSQVKERVVYSTKWSAIYLLYFVASLMVQSVCMTHKFFRGR